MKELREREQHHKEDLKIVTLSHLRKSGCQTATICSQQSFINQMVYSIDFMHIFNAYNK